MRSKIPQIAFCLVLGNVPIGVAQTNFDLRNWIDLASIGCRLQIAPEGPCVGTCDLTNQHLLLLSVRAPRSDLNSGFNYSMRPGQQRGEAEIDQSGFTSRNRLEDLPRTASPQGWRIGGGGALSYTAWSQRWHLVFNYAPDLGALRQDFERASSFSLIWQYSFGKHKPARWADVPMPNLSEHARPTATP